MRHFGKAFIPMVAVLAVSGCSRSGGLQFETLSVSEALAKAKEENKLVMIHFGSPG